MANLRANNLTGTGGRNAIDGSVFFPDNSYLEVTTTSDLALGTGDFTIETWVNFTKIDTYQSIIDFRGSGNGAFPFIVRDTDGDLYYYVNSAVLINNVPARGNNSWHHIAVVRNSGTTKFYLNGKEEGSASDSTTYVASNNPTIAVSTAESNDLLGHLSNLRIVKGTAVYTAAFTPPTEKLTAIDGTVLLCCQDSDDPTQEATGKTITGVGGLDITQAEKINGRFSGDPASNGWTVHSGASASYANGQWTVTSPNSAAWSGASTSFTSVIGQQYRITGIVVTSNNWGSVSVANGGQSAAKITYAGWSGGSSFPLTVNKIFTATATTTHVSIDNLNTTNATVTTVQYISVQPVEVGKAPRVLPQVGVDPGVTFKGDTKINSQGYMYFPTGDTAQRGRGRGLQMGSYLTPNASDKAITYINIQSTGNTQYFGDLLAANATGAAVASSTRAVYGGGWTSPGVEIEYVTIATTGNAIDFGANRTQGKGAYAPGSGNATRGLFWSAQNHPSYYNTIDYITIATTGACAEFGEINKASGRYGGATFAESTRAVYSGGVTGATSTALNEMDRVEIATTGDGTDFGDLTTAKRYTTGASDSTRGVVYAGGAPADSTIIEYITIQGGGGSTDFGDATVARAHIAGMSNSIRGVFAGGYASGQKNVMDSITFQTTGNAVDWGDYVVGTKAGSYSSGTSDSHGGLS